MAQRLGIERAAVRLGQQAHVAAKRELRGKIAVLWNPEFGAGLGLDDADCPILAVPPRHFGKVAAALAAELGERVGPALHRAGRRPCFESGASSSNHTRCSRSLKSLMRNAGLSLR